MGRAPALRTALVAVALATAAAGPAPALATAAAAGPAPAPATALPAPQGTPCPDGPDDCHGRAVVDAGDGGFDLGLYYADPAGRAHRVAGTEAACPGCEWQLTVACDGSRPEQPGDGGRPVPHCNRAAATCPAGIYHLVWLRRPGAPWELTDTVCLLVGTRVSTVQDLAAELTHAFRHLPLPRPVLRVQPRRHAVVGLPAVAYAEPERTHRVTLRVAGFAVDLRADAVAWRWSFGDGSPAVETAGPGAAYPRHAVSHLYRRPGAATVGVRCVWRGSYRVAGVPAALAVPDPVIRDGTATLLVREARAELVGDRGGRPGHLH